MGAGGNQTESGRLEAGGEGINIIDSELDLDFAVSGHAASIKKGSRIEQAVVARPKSCFGTEKVTFFIIPVK